MTGYDWGWKYAESIGADEAIVDAIFLSSLTIPSGDYLEMRRAGIENPDASEFWDGYNAYIEEVLEAREAEKQAPVAILAEAGKERMATTGPPKRLRTRRAAGRKKSLSLKRMRKPAGLYP